MTPDEIRAEIAAKRDAIQAQQPATAPVVDPALKAEVQGKADQRAKQQTGDYAADIAKSLGSGVAKGIVGTPGLGGDIESGMKALHGWIQEKLWGLPANPEISGAPNLLPTSQDVINTVGDYGGETVKGALNYEPQTTPGKYAATVGEFAGGNLVPGFGAARGAKTGVELGQALTKELLTQGVIPGVASEAAGQAAQAYAPGAETAARIVTGGGAAAGASAVRGPMRGSQTSTVPGMDPVRTQAAAKVGEAIQDVGGPQKALAEMQAVGPEARPWDVGTETRSLGEAVYTTPGPQTQPIKEFLLARKESLRGENSLLSKALDEHVEPKAANFMDQSDEAKAARARQADVLFTNAAKDAEGKTISTQAALDYIDSKLPTSVAAGATNLLPNEQRLLQIRGTLENRTDFRSLKLAKENLDGMIGEGKIAGQNVGDLIEIKRRVVDALSDATTRADGTSSYREALKAYRTDSEILEAMDTGQTLFDKSTRPDEFARQWRDMSDEQRTAAKMGARDSIAAVMGNPANDFAAGMNKLRSNFGREKMNIMLGKEATDALYARLDGLARQEGTVKTAESQSVTAARQRYQKKVENPADETITAPPLSASPGFGQVATGLASKLYSKVANPLRSAEVKAVNADTGRLLTAAPDDRAAFLNRMVEVYERGQERRLPAGGYGGSSAYQGWRADEDEDKPLTFSVRPRRRE